MRKTGSVNASTTEKRRHIIFSALASFNMKGFTDASMEDIRSRAGVSNGSLYHHFKSKEQLAAAVYLEGIKDFQAVVIEALNKADSAKNGVEALVFAHLFWMAENPDWARYLERMRHASFMKESEGAISEANRIFGAAMCGFFERHMESGSIIRLPLGVAIALVLGPCQEYGRLRLLGVTEDEWNRAAREIARAAERAVCAD
ncbi:MAG: TetR/AcrR family transcriptional regulator [Deltaproteobacteria bacterium]|nr:TetR/AcrR family transcriptional regulator [Deltaproteobacteria bacterium]